MAVNCGDLCITSFFYAARQCPLSLSLPLEFKKSRLGKNVIGVQSTVCTYIMQINDHRYVGKPDDIEIGKVLISRKQDDQIKLYLYVCMYSM